MCAARGRRGVVCCLPRFRIDLPLVVPRLSESCPQCFPHNVCTLPGCGVGLASACGHGGSGCPSLLLDPCCQLGDLGVHRLPFRHELADLAVGVNHGGVIATAEL